jgi:hypothetical protein
MLANGTRVCTCPKPIESPIPAHAGQCLRCVSKIESLVTDEIVADWFDRLAESLFAYEKGTGRLLTSDEWDTYREHAVAREKEGRPRFLNRFMNRNNRTEGREEACDLSIYPLLDSLQYELLTGRDDRDVGLALSAARKAYSAYLDLLQLQAKREGDTGPGWDE